MNILWDSIDSKGDLQDFKESLHTLPDSEYSLWGYLEHPKNFKLFKDSKFSNDSKNSPEDSKNSP